MKTHGKGQIEKLPFTYRFSESALYQPINGHSVDDDRLALIDQKKEAAKRRYKVRRNLEDQYRIFDIELQERTKQRAHNRQRMNRYEEEINRGFDIINNVGFEGKGAMRKTLPQIKPTPKVWDKVMS
jgi:hypothetical protein